MSFGATVAKSASAKAVGLEAKVKAAMKAVIEEDLFSMPDHQIINAALCGVLLDIGKDSPDGQLLATSARQMNKVQAWLQAAIAGVAGDPPEVDASVPPITMWWAEVKGV